ncbi:MAG: hypothetical protein WBO35_01005 [Candidatus Saccharimonadales bacterium]
MLGKLPGNGLSLEPQDVERLDLFDAVRAMPVVAEATQNTPVRALERRMVSLCEERATSRDGQQLSIAPFLEIDEDKLEVLYGLRMVKLTNGDKHTVLTMQPKDSDKVVPLLGLLNGSLQANLTGELDVNKAVSQADTIISRFEKHYQEADEKAKLLAKETQALKREKRERVAKRVGGTVLVVGVVSGVVGGVWWLTKRDVDAEFDAKGYSLTDVNSGKANEVIVPKYSLDLVNGKPVKVDDVPEVGAVVFGRDLKFRVDDGPREINIVVPSGETPVNGQQYCEKAEIVGPIPEDSTLHAATYYPTFETEVSTAEKPLSNATVVFEPEKRIVKACVNEFYPGTSKFAVVFDLVNGK